MKIWKKASVAAALASAMFATAANAALIVIETSPPAGGFTQNNVQCATPTTPAPCTFSDEGTFVTPAGYQLVSATISTISSSALTNIDFGSVLLNGVAFTMSPTGVFESGFISMQPFAPGGVNRLSVTGTTGGNGSYRGTLSFASMAAVPEPTTWMLMLMGMAGVGFSMRRKEKQTLRVRYA